MNFHDGEIPQNLIENTCSVYTERWNRIGIKSNVHNNGMLDIFKVLSCHLVDNLNMIYAEQDTSSFFRLIIQ